MKNITQAQLQEHFYYDPLSGEVTHLTNKVKAKAGSRAGSSSKSKSRYLRVNGKKELEHRMIWLYLYGCLPDGEIDHENHDRGDNRLCNLRVVDHATNMKNIKKLSSNSTGCSGVSIDKRCGKYRAYINIDKKHKGLGYFATYEAAVLARQAALFTAGGYHANHGS